MHVFDGSGTAHLALECHRRIRNIYAQPDPAVNLRPATLAIWQSGNQVPTWLDMFLYYEYCPSLIRPQLCLGLVGACLVR